MTLADANLRGAQKLANVVTKTGTKIISVKKIPVIGFVAKVSGTLTILSNAIESVDEWEKGNTGTAVWKGAEAAATTAFLLFGGEEIELFWNLGAMAIDNYREFHN